MVRMLRGNSATSNESSKYMEGDVADVSDVVRAIQRLAQASYSLSRAEDTEIQEDAEVSKVAMTYGIEKLVAEAALLPMLFRRYTSGHLQALLVAVAVRLSRPLQGETERGVPRAEPTRAVHFARWACGNACCRPGSRAFRTLDKCSCHCGSPQQRLEDGATVGPRWVRSAIVQLRSVRAVSRCSGHRLSRYTRVRMHNRSQRVLRKARPSSLDAFLLEPSRRPSRGNLSKRVETPESIVHES